LIASSIKEEIKTLFENEIGRSIYAISEKYKINFLDVVNIRKPLLKKQGLKYDSKSKNIVDEEGQLPVNWQGDRLTQILGETILKLKGQDIETKDVAYECNISIADLKKFISEYENSRCYDYAKSIN
jgi:hypothetical protein